MIDRFFFKIREWLLMRIFFLIHPAARGDHAPRARPPVTLACGWRPTTDLHVTVRLLL